MPKELLEGNLAIAEAAIRSGLEAYFGYPITPQTELLEWMSKRMPELGRAFLQAESELGAINMVYGAACTGARAMTSSSSPGVSLMMEGLSYIAGTEVPMVLVDIQRGGPGLGNIAPAQADYNQIVHGGGHGDYHPIVLAPSSVQEAIDLTVLAFDLAEKYRTIAILLAEGCIGQMMEPAELPEMRPPRRQQGGFVTPEWAVTGSDGRERHILTSIYLNPEIQEGVDIRLMKRWQQILANEVRYKEYYLDNAELVVVGFGTAGRIALSAVRAARAEGFHVGLFRPISVNPFPQKALAELSQRVENILVVEMNAGQMLDDVRLAVQGRSRIEFFARFGGVVPMPEEILSEIKRMISEPLDKQLDIRQSWLQRLELLRASEEK
jgi:2-oxoglutarate ferredoxin oxidoreductase subunit alpha